MRSRKHQPENRLHERHVLSHHCLEPIAELHGLAGRPSKQIGGLIVVREAAVAHEPWGWRFPVSPDLRGSESGNAPLWVAAKREGVDARQPACPPRLRGS